MVKTSDKVDVDWSTRVFIGFLCAVMGLVLSSGLWFMFGLWQRAWWQMTLGAVVIGSLCYWEIQRVAHSSEDPEELFAQMKLVLRLSLTGTGFFAATLFGLSALGSIHLARGDVLSLYSLAGVFGATTFATLSLAFWTRSRRRKAHGPPTD
jgi:hypothetical protein